MTELHAWPSYRIGPHDSVFALGVASVNYASLEFAFAGVFANVMGIDGDATSELLPKISNDVRLRLMREVLSGRDWPTKLKEVITHFSKGFEILVENRNQLMHSNLVADVEGQIALYKSNRGGKTIATQISPANLRRVADDMMAFRDYGLQLTTVIGLELSLPGALAADQWPAKPPLPRKLDYNSRPYHGKKRAAQKR